MKKGMRYPAVAVTGEQVKAMIQACGRGKTAVRNRALLAVLYRAGLRISEALALEPRDIDANGVIRVLHGKGDKARVVAVDPGTLALLQLWLDRRPAGQTVFCTLHGSPVQSEYVRALLRRLARRAGIEGRITPHGLRHGFAVSLMNESVPLGVISGALGHTSVATTAVYLNHLNPAAVISTLQGRSW